MADKNNASTDPEAAGDLRGTLVKRLAVAGILVAVLLGVLAFFDYLATPEEPEAPTFTKPVPVPPKKEVTQPVKPAETLPEPPKPEAAPEKPAEPPPKPEMPAQPAAPAPEARPEMKMPAKPGASQAQAVKPATPVQPPLARPALPASQPEGTAGPAVRGPSEPKAPVEPRAPAPRPPEAAAPAHAVPAPLRLFAGYVLQAGVFTSVQRAEELHAKLTLNGIPSTLEARVQAGPFKTREEAAAARDKMQALGIDTVLIPPKGGR